mmetsp:Transcript_44413/g.96527  ORF Transcript_44413/g.96527 Transcript_44413/m.96527 type:complete len:466 (+) Transcript_44413:58-1455(+)
MVRILLCGDVRGRVGQLCEHVAKLHAKLEASQRFEAVFCVGEFSSEEMELDVKPPIPVHFIDSGPAAQDLIEASPQGEEIGENLHFLGHFGVAKIAGISVAYLSGRAHEELFSTAPGEGIEAPEDGEAHAEPEGEGAVSASLKQKYGSNEADPDLNVAQVAKAEVNAERSQSWEELRAKEKAIAHQQSQLFIDGRYTPLAVERLLEEVTDSGGVDLLLTSEWPTGCLKGVAQAWPQEVETRKLAKAAARTCATSAVAMLAAATEPKYHAVGLGGVFWRRPPWRHERRGEVVAATGELRCGVCRLITLGAADGHRPAPAGVAQAASAASSQADGGTAAKPKPEKWLHGLDLNPHAMPACSEDATVCPWSQKAVSEAAGSDPVAEPLRMPGIDDKEERRRWLKRFGCLPQEMQSLSDKITKANEPKEKKEKHKSLYKVSEKEKKRRKTGGDGHLPFHAKERMHSTRN